MKLKSKNWEWIKALQNNEIVMCVMNDDNIIMIMHYDNDRMEFHGSVIGIGTDIIIDESNVRFSHVCKKED